MRIFVAGATGALGSRLIPLLLAGGHSVVGSTHTTANLHLIRDMGAESVLADGLDAKAITAAVVAAKPDVMVHQMTGFGKAGDLRHFSPPRPWRGLGGS